MREKRKNLRQKSKKFVWKIKKKKLGGGKFKKKREGLLDNFQFFFLGAVFPFHFNPVCLELAAHLHEAGLEILSCL